MKNTIYLSLAILVTISGCASPDPTITFNPERTEQDSGSEALFIGISPVDENIVWLSGTSGTYSVTEDGGETWNTSTVPGADTLQFRDVHAVDRNTAYLLSIGSGDQSRIYKTNDGGDTWRISFQNDLPDAFFDCIDFFDDNTGLGYSDSIEGEMVIIKTTDGESWSRIDPSILPAAQDGEGGFAASGTCLRVVDDQTAIIATGAAPQPRIIVTRDRGESWEAIDVPMTGGSGSTGNTSVSFFDSNVGMAVGGDIAKPDSFTTNVIVTRDGGRTWTNAAQPVTRGAFYGSSTVPGAPSNTLVAVGPAGIDVTTDLGQTWTNLDTLNYWSAAFVSPTVGWTIGTEGKVTKWSLFTESE